VNSRNDLELLAPAGNWECARAAVANGADAIFFGLPRFNARLRADNFSAEELPELMQFLHSHGVRGLVAFNTLVFTSELEDAEEQLAWLQESGVDAIIVQDLGLASVAKKIAPSVQLHASTQMTITSPEGLEFAQQLGLSRAVLARELSLRELARFRNSPVPLETFVHGALCVAYSGQCLTSESLGQRSANRGECAQACRMPYQLVVDGELRDLGDKRYLLSPQDLAAVAEIPKLIELGVTSFKIEGRLKSPEYVAAVTRVYRKAIDAAIAGRPDPVTENDRYSLEMTFSRGLFTGWMHGVNHQELVGARYGKKRGAFLGRVTQSWGDSVELDQFTVAVHPGDGVVFDTGEDTNQEQGGFVFHAEGQRLDFQRGKLNALRIPPGTRVWKTSDPALDKALRTSFKGTIPQRKHRQLTVIARGNVGSPLILSGTDADGKSASVESSMPLEPATKHPLSTEFLTQQIRKLGGTPWELMSLDNQISGEVILPMAELNRLKRALLHALESQDRSVRQPAQRGIMLSALQVIAQQREASIAADTTVELLPLCRSLPQIEASLTAGMKTVYVDFEDVRQYTSAVAMVRQQTDAAIFLATPRIQKPAEAGFFKLITRSEPDGILIRNLGAISFFKQSGMRLRADFSLNIANPLSAEFMMQQGFERLTISSDLNIEQALALLNATPPGWFELILHQHMPMFHMEHCVFAAFLSNGKTFLDCGRPCEKHQVKLRDRVGMEHPLKADVGCRNTLFNGVAQTGAKYFPDLHQAGLRQYRIDFLEESAEEVTRILEAYQQLIAGQTDPTTLWQQLKIQSQLGVTSGTLRQLETAS
jgi:U32 family peptidase